MATSNANADIANNNSLWPCIPSSSYGHPCLDLFFNTLRPEWRDANPCLTYLEQLLPLAWSHNPLTTLKLIFTFDSIDFSDTKFDTPCFGSTTTTPRLLRNLHFIANLPLVCYPHHGVGGTTLSKFSTRFYFQNETATKMTMLLCICVFILRPRLYRLLHDRVVDIFVDHLKSDIDKMNSHLLVSEAAECCTSTRVGHEHWTGTIFLLESIARRLAPPESDQSQEWELKWLHNEFLGPLTNNYNCQGREPCVVKKSLKKVKAAAVGGGDISIIKPDALLPNEIIKYVQDEDVGEVAELQRKAMVEDLYLKQQQKQVDVGDRYKRYTRYIFASE